KDSYGHTTDFYGFGYGIQQLANTQASRSNPVDMTIDQPTRVALTAAGHFHETFNPEQLTNEAAKANGVAIPESWGAQSFDVQEAHDPLLVGGVGSLPSGSKGAVEIQRFTKLQTLLAKTLGLNSVELTNTEQADAARLE